jgi:transcriptional regulator GlxA family with amidase domain
LDNRVREVIRIVESDLSKSASVDELAAHVGLGESRLRHLFHKCVGISLTAFRRDRRLQQAANRLTTTWDDVRQIAFGVGFQSASPRDFRLGFRKRFGMSPTSYRQRFWRCPGFRR